MKTPIQVMYTGDRVGVYAYEQFCPKGEVVTVRGKFGIDASARPDMEVIADDAEPVVEAAPESVEEEKPKRSKKKNDNGDTE